MAYDKVVDSAALDKQMLDMANAVRTKTVWTNQNKDVTSFEDENGNYNEIDARYRIPSADLAWQIRLIDKNRRMTLYPHGLDNGHYGVMAARCAETYLAARERGAAVFDYNDDVNVFNTARRKHPTGQREVYSAVIKDSEGRCVCDCSSFIGLVLRGIPYERSPFAKPDDYEGHFVLNGKTHWVPAEEMEYGTEGWEIPLIDMQPENEYRLTGFDGYSSIRGAAQQAEFFYKYGYVVYDRDRDGVPTAALQELVKPGDLIFWSYMTPDGAYNREKEEKVRGYCSFRMIHHVGMVCENTTKYINVTGAMGNSENEPTVLRQELQNAVFYQVSLICRPDYRKEKPLKTPAGINLLGYPWNTDAFDGLSFAAVGERGDTLRITGTCVGAATAPKALKGHGASKYRWLHLTPGEYEFHIGRNPEIDDVPVRLELCSCAEGRSPAAIGNGVSCSGSAAAAFTLTEDTDVIVRFYCAADARIDCEITPTLVRIASEAESSGGYAAGYEDGLAARKHEAWTFTLTDGTIVEKEVALL